MITVNLDKAKIIAHKIRREFREEAFAPLDAQVVKQIPGTDLVEIERQRQAVRDKYAAMQEAIESAESPEALKAALFP